ncbi:MAG: YncE family protein [Proteobacteria bacterium]|nr:YncE family protein [Pseudomonadota bacterium]
MSVAILLPLAMVFGCPVPVDAADSKPAGVEFSVHNLDPEAGQAIRAGGDLLVKFRLSDPDSGFGLSQLHPAAWLSPREKGAPAPSQQECENLIRGMGQFGVTHADDDLNGYYILTLNADNSVSILNPMVSLNTSNQKAHIILDGEAHAWDFDPNTALAWVTLPDDNKVAVVDVKGRRVAAYLAVGNAPRSVEVQPDGRFVWVGNDDSGTVSVLAPSGQGQLRSIEVGRGPIDFAFDEQGRYVIVSAGGAGRVSVIDTGSMKVVSSLEVGEGSLQVAWAELAGAFYLLNPSRNTVTVAYPREGRAAVEIDVAEGATTLEADPQGRWVFVVNPEARAVDIIDTAAARLSRRVALEEKPSHVLFSSIFAYVYHADSSNLSLVKLSALADAEAAPVLIIPMGVERPEGRLARPGLLPMDVLPDEGGAVVANPVEKVIYFYTDGMMSPMGSFKTWASNPLGVILYDRSLRERGNSGVYETVTRLDEPGVYDVPFVLASPRVVTCFEFEVAGEPGQGEAVKPLFRGLFVGEDLAPGDEVTLRYQVVDGRDGRPLTGLDDLRLIAFRAGENWSARSWTREVEDGVYEAGVTFPRGGRYLVQVEARSLGIAFGDAGRDYADVSQGAAR